MIPARRSSGVRRRWRTLRSRCCCSRRPHSSIRPHEAVDTSYAPGEIHREAGARGFCDRLLDSEAGVPTWTVSRPATKLAPPRFIACTGVEHQGVEGGSSAVAGELRKHRRNRIAEPRAESSRPAGRAEARRILESAKQVDLAEGVGLIVSAICICAAAIRWRRRSWHLLSGHASIVRADLERDLARFRVRRCEAAVDLFARVAALLKEPRLLQAHLFTGEAGTPARRRAPASSSRRPRRAVDIPCIGKRRHDEVELELMVVAVEDQVDAG